MSWREHPVPAEEHRSAEVLGCLDPLPCFRLVEEVQRAAGLKTHAASPPDLRFHDEPAPGDSRGSRWWSEVPGDSNPSVHAPLAHRSRLSTLLPPRRTSNLTCSLLSTDLPPPIRCERQHRLTRKANRGTDRSQSLVVLDDQPSSSCRPFSKW